MRPLKLLSLLPHTAPLRKKQSTVFPTVQLYFSHKINRRSKKYLTEYILVFRGFFHTGSAAAQHPHLFSLLHAKIEKMKIFLFTVFYGVLGRFLAVLRGVGDFE